jgi:hypothetical protein
MQIGASVLVGFLLLMIYTEVIPVLPSASNSIDLTWLDESKGIAIFIHVDLSAPQDFTATLPVSVSAYGTISNQTLRWVWLICACFSDAYQMSGNQIIPNPNEQPFAGVYLNGTTTRPSEYTSPESFAGEYLVGFPQSIEWQNPTKTIPYIIVIYRNTTVVNGVGQNVEETKDFPDKGIEIAPFSTTESNKATMKYYFAEYLIIGFGIVQGVLLLVERHEPTEQKTLVLLKSIVDKLEANKQEDTRHQVTTRQEPKPIRRTRQKTEHNRKHHSHSTKKN